MSSSGLLSILTLDHKHFFLRRSENRCWMGNWQAVRAFLIFSHPRFSRERTAPRQGFRQLWKVPCEVLLRFALLSSNAGLPHTPLPAPIFSPHKHGNWETMEKMSSLPFQKTFYNVTVFPCSQPVGDVDRVCRKCHE